MYKKIETLLVYTRMRAHTDAH